VASRKPRAVYVTYTYTVGLTHMISTYCQLLITLPTPHFRCPYSRYGYSSRQICRCSTKLWLLPTSKTYTKMWHFNCFNKLPVKKQWN